MFDKRYERNIGTYSIEGQKLLSSSHVGIVGAGGLGGVVFEILVRAGVGKITIADNDVFEKSNLNRQLLSSESALGFSKSDAAIKRAYEINSGIEVVSHKEYISQANGAQIFSGVNLIADCTDSICTRYELQEIAKKLNVPLVHAAVAGQTGQVGIGFPNDNIIEKIYGERSTVPNKGSEVLLGTPPETVFTIASLQAKEIISLLNKRSAPTSGTLLRVDIAKQTFSKFTFAK